jgi:hypothetical protein
MPAFTVGEDCRASILGPYSSTPLDLPMQTTFTLTVNQSLIQVQDLDGITNSRTVIKGPTGTISWARSNNTLDVMAAQMYQDWLANTPIGTGSITYVISELDGTETTVHIANVSFAIKDIGKFDPMKSVSQTLSWSGENFTLA